MIALHNTLKFSKNSDGEIIATNGSYNFIIYRPKMVMGREIFWVCYAWPVEKGVTGERAMVVCDYQWYRADNEVQKYSGKHKPKYEAALLPNTFNGISSGAKANDGETWYT